MKSGYLALIILLLFGAVAVLASVNADESHGESTLPDVSIDTKNGEQVLSDEDYLRCTVNVSGDDDVLVDADGKIRGRGNTTWHGNMTWWDMPKKPYKLKLSEEADLFGFGPTDTYLFIANYADQTLSRDYFAYTIAAAIGMPYITQCQFVNLYMNGIYQGVYMVCEKVGIGPGGIDIAGISGDPADTGYLIEMDGWLHDKGTLDVDYFTMNWECYGIKDPDVEDQLWTSAHFDFIRDRIVSAFDILNTGTYADVCSVFDMGSFALMYIVNELFNTEDIAWSSFYMYYDPADGLLHGGPVWDFDTSSGNSRSEAADPCTLYAAGRNGWFSAMLEFEEFRELVGNELSSVKDLILETMDTDMEYEYAHAYDFEKNFRRWGVLGSTIWANPIEFVHLRSWESHMEYMYGWLAASLEYMCSVYCV